MRDLLLGMPNADVDFVVEGDAVELVRALRDAYGGDMRSHAQFGTAKWLLTPEVAAALDIDPAANGWPKSVDFVTARMEYYEEPTALPTVQRSSIKPDLYRRDFTINTLAIRLSPGPLGDLLDFYGGEQDLRDGVIRVLHSLSFIDDPTRILRAVRLEQRLGFTIEPRTEELIEGALPLLDRVSGDRIRHELALILAEPQPLPMLARLHGLGVLSRIHPQLVVDDWVRAFYALRYAREHPPWPSLADFDNWMLTTFSLLTSRLPPDELERLGRRLMFRRLHLTTCKTPAPRRVPACPQRAAGAERGREAAGAAGRGRVAGGMGCRAGRGRAGAYRLLCPRVAVRQADAGRPRDPRTHRPEARPDLREVAGRAAPRVA